MIRLDADRRREITALRKTIKALEAPETAAGKKARADARKARQKAIGKPAPGQKQPRVHDKPYLAWVRRQPCAVADHECSGPVEAAHLRYSDAKQGRVNPGMQCKSDDAWVTPLCRHHHQHDQHKRNERAFWSDRGIEPADLCRALRAAYEAAATSNGSEQ